MDAYTRFAVLFPERKPFMDTRSEGCSHYTLYFKTPALSTTSLLAVLASGGMTDSYFRRRRSLGDMVNS
jgi:hypothetical protein